MAQIPQNIEAEQAVLGSILLDGRDALARLSKTSLAPADFYMTVHGEFYRLLMSLGDSHPEFDTVTVRTAIKDWAASNNDSMALITDEYLLRLLDAPIAPSNVAHYASLVAEASVRRSVMEKSKDLYFMARSGLDKFGKPWSERLLDPESGTDIGALVRSKLAPPENPLTSGLISSEDIPESSPPSRLWFGLYRSSVVLFVGETGAGKSSLLYNLAVHACRNEPLFDIPFESHVPLRVLYIDPENAGNWSEGHGGNCATKLNRIGAGRPRGLEFHNGDGVNLGDPRIMDALEQMICQRRYDIVILDPIANLFKTRDESQNSEAADHFTRLKTISRRTGACIIAVHHTGKGVQNDYGRGASARLASADVGMMFRFKSEDEEQDDTYSGETLPRADVCRLQITKNRMEGKGSLYVRMAGDDKFVKATFTEWRDGAVEGRQSKSDEAERHIVALLQGGKTLERSEIINEVMRHGVGRSNVEKGIAKLSNALRLKEERVGRRTLTYCLTSPESRKAELEQKRDEQSQQAVDSFFGQGQSVEKEY